MAPKNMVMAVFIVTIFLSLSLKMVLSSLIASDLSGTYLALCSSFQSTYSPSNPSSYIIRGYIYVSSNAGISWTQTNAPQDYYTSITSDVTGLFITAVSASRTITSNNYGQSWVYSDTYYGGIAVASDSSGQYIVKTAEYTYATQIYLSNNFGESYTTKTFPVSYTSNAIAFGRNNNTIVVTTTNNGIYTSLNFGTTWIKASGAPNYVYTSLAKDSTGLIMYATTSNNGILKSNNGGLSWFSLSGTNGFTWSSIASDSTGTLLTAVSSSGDVGISSSSGASWNILYGDSSTYWIGVVSDASGQFINGLTGTYATSSNYYYSNYQNYPTYQAFLKSTNYGASFDIAGCYPGYGVGDNGVCQPLGYCGSNNVKDLYNPSLSGNPKTCAQSTIIYSDGYACSRFCNYPQFTAPDDLECEFDYYSVGNGMTVYESNDDDEDACEGVALQVSRPGAAAIIVVAVFIYLIPFIHACRKIYMSYEFWKAFNLTCVLFFTTVVPFLDALTDLLYIVMVPWIDPLFIILCALFFAWTPVFCMCRYLWNTNAQANYYVLHTPLCILNMFETVDTFPKLFIYSMCSLPFMLVNLVTLIPIGCVLFVMRLSRVHYFGIIHNALMYIWTADIKHNTESIINIAELNDTTNFAFIFVAIPSLILQIMNVAFVGFYFVPPIAIVSIIFSALMCMYGLYNFAYFKLYKRIKMCDIPSAMDCLDRSRDNKDGTTGGIDTENGVKSGDNEMVVLNSLHGGTNNPITARFMENTRLENEFLLKEYNALKQDFAALRHDVNTLLGKPNAGNQMRSVPMASVVSPTATSMTSTAPTSSGVFYASGDMSTTTDSNSDCRDSEIFKTGVRMG